MILSDLLHCCALPSPPFVHADVHANTLTHSLTLTPPWSPCGFKVLILIRFELTYCQSSFSCSSETIGSYHQDLDLGSRPLGWPVPTGSQWNTNERSFANLTPWVSCPIRRPAEKRTQARVPSSLEMWHRARPSSQWRHAVGESA